VVRVVVARVVVGRVPEVAREVLDADALLLTGAEEAGRRRTARLTMSSREEARMAVMVQNDGRTARFRKLPGID
jgi:hypothetical protein